MNYKVGQVLFMISIKSQKIIPMQIVEEVSRTTMTGTEKTFMVKLPDDDATVVDINHLKGEIFSDIDRVKHSLIEKATASIEKMIIHASHIAKNKYNISQKENDVQVETNNDIIMVDLGNGVKAKMNTSNLDKVVNQ
mgnify:CR=1 FL=1